MCIIYLMKYFLYDTIIFVDYILLFTFYSCFYIHCNCSLNSYFYCLRGNWLASQTIVVSFWVIVQNHDSTIWTFWKIQTRSCSFMTTYLFPFLLQKQIILLDFHLTEVSNNSLCKEYICKYLRNPHFCFISKIKRWGGEYCIKTYQATPRPLLCHLSGNATPSVMSHRTSRC